MSPKFQLMRLVFASFVLLLGSLFIVLPVAASGMKILSEQTHFFSAGVRQTRYVIGLAHEKPAVLTVSWSIYLERPEIFTNTDRSLMAIQTMPYWRQTGRARFGRRISLLVSTPHRGITVIPDFSERLNHLRLANKARWNPLTGHYFRPASTIFLTASFMHGREIYAQQYAIDPKVGLPEYNTLAVRINPDASLSFISFTSQGF